MREFARERDWEKFHTPKNVAMALVGEAAELCELFQWLTPEESWQIMDKPARAKAVRDEIADVLNYALRLADLLEVDIGEAMRSKIADNARKYPADRVRGTAMKYSELDSSD